MTQTENFSPSALYCINLAYKLWQDHVATQPPRLSSENAEKISTALLTGIENPGIYLGFIAELDEIIRITNIITESEIDPSETQTIQLKKILGGSRLIKPSTLLHLGDRESTINNLLQSYTDQSHILADLTYTNQYVLAQIIVDTFVYASSHVLRKFGVIDDKIEHTLVHSMREMFNPNSQTIFTPQYV